MKKPVKGHLPLVATVVAVVGTCLVTGFFLFVVNDKTDWREPPQISNILSMQSQVSGNKSVKTTYYTIKDNWDRVKGMFYIQAQTEGWYPVVSKLSSAQYQYVDSTKDLNIPFINYQQRNECPAFFIDVTFESLGDDLTGVKLIQSVGPCGNKLS